ncbi:Cuticle protein 16.8 like protein [Argiope bruennichi]|uniref:Cuticle protein 16.8 like protein n=1 Tax=Argiope bruennichi TaxID=94029 RepID=A0A8T0FKM2_ARGBR|nr:Cuticle protein 16.8 like protein [Argiope bruennichi]
MKVFIVLAVLVAVVSSQNVDPLAKPIPYSFSYTSNTEDGGSSGHQENGDGAGRVTGSYTVTDLEGHNRVIEYIADENGFRATVRTNEPGTANLNSADVKMESTGDDNGIAAAYAGTLPAAAPAPAVAPVTSGRPGVRYVLVPVTDPRARGYY